MYCTTVMFVIQYLLFRGALERFCCVTLPVKFTGSMFYQRSTTAMYYPIKPNELPAACTPRNLVGW